MIGGFFGAIGRYAAGEWIEAENGFPFGTFVINLFGCFILGCFLTFVSEKSNIRPEFTLLIGTGFLGSFTTFSTFSLETVALFQEGLIVMAALYVLATTAVGLTLAFVGHRIALSRKTKKENL